MFRSAIAALVLALLLAGGANAAWAQKDDKREKARERIRAIVVTQLIEKLDLDDKTAAKLMPILEKAQDEAAAIQRDNRAARQELRRMHRRGNAKDAEILRLVDRLVENREKAHKVEAEMVAEARKVLKPMQAARLIVVLPRIKARIAAEIRKAVEGKRGGGAGADDDPDMPDTEDDEEF